jgi:hypothetical protein
LMMCVMTGLHPLGQPVPLGEAPEDREHRDRSGHWYQPVQPARDHLVQVARQVQPQAHHALPLPREQRPRRQVHQGRGPPARRYRS